MINNIWMNDYVIHVEFDICTSRKYLNMRSVQAKLFSLCSYITLVWNKLLSSALEVFFRDEAFA